MSENYFSVKSTLIARLSEPAPARVQLLTGPRQVGKTHLLLELAKNPALNASYLSADALEASLPGWWEGQFRRAVEAARVRPGALLIDEAAYLPDWSRIIKCAADELAREKIPLHLVVTGSAALTLGHGANETMAGRFERIRLFHWTPGDLAKAFSLESDNAIETAVRFGCFPGAMPFLADFPRWKAYVRESLVEPAIGRDLMNLEMVRRPALLRQLFALAACHAGEILSLNKISGSLTDPGTLDTLSHYLNLLQEAFLVTPLKKFSKKEGRRRASAPKLVPLSNAYLAAVGDGLPPTRAADPARWGRFVENACLSRAIGAGWETLYWREEPLEVDAVIKGEHGSCSLEIKTGSFTTHDLAPLLEFSRRFPEFQPVVLCEKKYLSTATRAGVRGLEWREFLWKGLQLDLGGFSSLPAADRGDVDTVD